MVAEHPLWQGWVTLLLIVLMLIALVRDFPPHLVMMLTVIIFIPLKIIDLHQAMRGFSDDAVLSVAVLFVVAKGVEKSGALQYISKILFKTKGSEEQLGEGKKKNKSSMAWVLLRFMLPSAIVSAFIVNIPLVALMIPLILNIHTKIGMHTSQLLMPLSFSVQLGGTATLIGDCTNLLVVSLAAKNIPGMRMHLFEIGLIGVPLIICGMLYMITLSGLLLPRNDSMQSDSTDERAISNNEQDGLDSMSGNRNISTFWQLPGFIPIKIEKSIIATIIILGMIIANALGVNLVTAGLVSAAAMLIIKCLTPKDAMDSLDLTVIITFAAALGISEAMIQSRAGTMLAKALMGMAGNSEFGLITCTYIATTVFSLTITNTAGVTLMFPVALEASRSRAVDFRPLAYSLIMASASALMTYYSCTTNLMIYERGSYKFTDYIKYGGPLQILLFGITVGIISTLKWWWLWWIALTVLAIVSTPFIAKLPWNQIQDCTDENKRNRNTEVDSEIC